MFGKARFTAAVLLVIGSLSLITPPANAAGNEPVDFRSLSVCSDSYETKQIAICVPKGENFVAQLSESNLKLGFTHNVVSENNEIFPLTQDVIDLSELPTATYVWQLFGPATTNPPQLIRKVKFKVIDLSMQMASARGVKQSLDSTFRESYVLSYDDRSLESFLTSEFGIASSNFYPQTLVSSATGKKIVSKKSRKIVEVGLNKNQFNQIVNDKRVLSIEKNMIRTMSSTTQNLAPWNLDRLDQESLPLSNSFTYETGATTPVIYVLDTGLNSTHTEFQGRVADCWYYDDMTTSCDDFDGHGTHVSGTALGTKYGVAKNAQLEFIKITYDDGSTSNFSIESALSDVWSQISLNHPNQPGVLNLSFGCYDYCSTGTGERFYFNKLVQKNIIPVVAAGNVFDDACYYAFGDLGAAPNNYAIVVGATWVDGNTDKYSWFSNYGPCVTIFAPGGAGSYDTAEDIASAGISSNSDVAYMSGTSMASPLVAGVIANYLSFYPTKSFAQVREWLLATARTNKINGLPANTVNKLVSIYKIAAAQTITFAPPTTLTTAQSPYSLTASASSGLTPVITSSTQSICTIAGTSLTILRNGTCTLVANQAGNDSYSAAAPVTKSISILSAQATLSISSDNSSAYIVGANVVLNTSGGSGSGAVTYALSTPNSRCNIVKNFRSTTLSTSTGAATTCAVTATKAASSTFAATTSSIKTFNFLGSQAPLNLSNSSTPGPTGSSITLSTTGGTDNGALSYALSVANGRCTILNSTLSVSAGAKTTCSVVATKAGTATYAPISTLPKVLTFLSPQAALSVSNSPKSGVVGTPITLTTSGGSGTGAVTFSTSTTGCSISSGTLTASIATTCLVFASKAIDNDYWSITADGAQFDIRRAQAPLTLNNTSPTGPTGSSVILSTSGGTGAGAVTYALSAANARCTILNATLTVSAGAKTTCSVIATKAATAEYRAISTDSKALTFLSPQAVLTVSNSPKGAVVGTSIRLTTSGGSGRGAVTFSTSTARCSINSGRLSAFIATTCSVEAFKAADADYWQSKSDIALFVFTPRP